VFLGATSYDGTAAVAGLAWDPAAGTATTTFTAPADGDYALWVRHSGEAGEATIAVDRETRAVVSLPAAAAPRNHLAIPRLSLGAGEHVAVVSRAPGDERDLGLDLLMILPLDGDDRFPEALARRVQPILRAGPRRRP
jgi:hypothetical protein